VAVTGLFVVENESYLEVKDCHVKSVRDAKVIQLTPEGNLKPEE
jgi:hypothetical protein